MPCRLDYPAWSSSGQCCTSCSYLFCGLELFTMVGITCSLIGQSPTTHTAVSFFFSKVNAKANVTSTSQRHEQPRCQAEAVGDRTSRNAFHKPKDESICKIIYIALCLIRKNGCSLLLYKNMNHSEKNGRTSLLNNRTRDSLRRLRTRLPGNIPNTDGSEGH